MTVKRFHGAGFGWALAFGAVCWHCGQVSAQAPERGQPQVPSGSEPKAVDESAAHELGAEPSRPAPNSPGSEPVVQNCATCHGESDGERPVVTEAQLAESVHEGMECTECHTAIERLPHPKRLPSAECGECHEEAVDAYRQHGRGIVGKSKYVPRCGDCHGSHRIVPVSERGSAVSSANLPGTCGRCHADGGRAERYPVLLKHPVETYSQSVHGRGVAQGKPETASCRDCHGSGGKAHAILPPGDSRSSINYFNVPKTCGKCHVQVTREYQEGIHGQLVLLGEVSAPACTNCHGEHQIARSRGSGSPVSPSRLAEATCLRCHESAVLSRKYGAEADREVSYVDSVHGLKSKGGDTTVANCASCHGAHKILPSSHPDSSVAAQNLAETCGSCHQDISRQFVTDPIHQSRGRRWSGWPRLFELFYIYLIAVVVGGMLAYCAADFLRHLRDTMREKQTERMRPDEVGQHAALALSFAVLVVSGFALRYYDTWWSEMLFGFEGGYAMRQLIHRVAAVGLVSAAVWHGLFLLTTRGRVFLRDMMPSIEDVKHLSAMVRYNLGRSEHRPLAGRFSFVEKTEYWALVWGTVIMVVTGLLLWFKHLFVQHLPKVVLDVCLVVHSYEAWLAFLSIVVWHLYATVFNPRVYPMNPSWVTGKMPERIYAQEHGPAEQSPESSAPDSES